MFRNVLKVLVVIGLLLVFVHIASGQQLTQNRATYYVPYFLVGSVADPEDAYADGFRLRQGFEGGLVFMNNDAVAPCQFQLKIFSEEGEYFQLQVQSAGINNLAPTVVMSSGRGPLSAGQTVFSLPAREVRRGWMEIAGDFEQATAFLFIRYKADGEIYTEATVPVITAKKRFVFYAKRYASQNQDRVHTSFGITNIQESPLTIQVIRRDRHGNARSESTFSLPPRSQITRQITAQEFGGELPASEYEGRIEFIADVPFLAVAFNVAQYGKFAAVPSTE